MRPLYKFLAIFLFSLGLCGIALGQCLPFRVTETAELDISIDGQPAGTITIGLYGETTPITVENFIGLCNGTKGYGYKNSPIHRVSKDFVIQGGDFENRDGTGGYSYFSTRYFDDENFLVPYDRAGVVGMAKVGSNPNTNAAQFFITLDAEPGLNGGYVAFGRVKRGMSVVKAINNAATITDSFKPLKPISITDCRIGRNQGMTCPHILRL